MTARKDGHDKRPSRPRGYWDSVVLPRAAVVVGSYTTGVTLRQLYYRLVADGTIDNEQSDYQRLALLTAEARLAGTFPYLIDNGATIDRPFHFDDAASAQTWLTNQFVLDRASNQPYLVYLGIEKAGLAAQMRSWFHDRSLPILALGGWGGTSLVQDVRQEIADDGRPSVLIYGGDFDPSGAYIGHSFADRVDAFDRVIRVGLNVDQLVGLPVNPLPKKVERDPRAAQFTTEFGPRLTALGLNDLVQFELDALPPTDLQALYESALVGYWDGGDYRAILAEEASERATLKGMRP